jgi:hypothetical protein
VTSLLLLVLELLAEVLLLLRELVVLVSAVFCRWLQLRARVLPTLVAQFLCLRALRTSRPAVMLQLYQARLRLVSAVLLL